MVDCKYHPRVRCMRVNSFPSGNKAHTRCLGCDFFNPMWHCHQCTAWDEDQGCTMSDLDRWYACPIESSAEENRAAQFVKEVTKEYDEGPRNRHHDEHYNQGIQ